MTDIAIASIEELTDFVRSTHVECTGSGIVQVVSIADGSLVSSGYPSIRSPLTTSNVVKHFNSVYEADLVDNIPERCEQWMQLFRVAALSVSQGVRETKLTSNCKESIEILRVSGSFETIAKSGLELWVEHSHLIAAVQRVFSESSPAIAELKKIALDVGYLLLTHYLDFEHSSLGFEAPIRRSDVAVASLLSQLLESFMVTIPAHFPFMPARHFAPICWPIQVSDSCSGKVHSLFRFPDQSMQRDGALRYCNYTTVKRRQPWMGQLTALQLIEIAIIVKTTLDTTPYATPFTFASKTRPFAWNESPTASLEECDMLLGLLQGVVRRLRDVDPKLLYHKAPFSFVESSTCQQCSCSIGSLFERLNPLRSSDAGAAPISQRLHCRLCLSSVCAACISQTTYVGDQVCRRCDLGLEALSLRDLTKTRRRLQFQAPRLTQAALKQHQKHLIGDEPGCASDEMKDDEEGGADSPCCSETMSESLKDWRDNYSIHSSG